MADLLIGAEGPVSTDRSARAISPPSTPAPASPWTWKNPKLLIIEVSHKAEDYSHWTMEVGDKRKVSSPFYENDFVCIPFETPFRPERATPRPFVHGPQTAVVTGASGQEIHTDKFGRVKVKFAWDRHGPDDDGSSCWIRVSQGWAGQMGRCACRASGRRSSSTSWKASRTPDRDRARLQPAERGALRPAGEQDAAGIKSRSSQNGSAANNEIRFEDKKGAEHIFVHAARPHHRVEYETRSVGMATVPNQVPGTGVAAPASSATTSSCGQNLGRRSAAP